MVKMHSLDPRTATPADLSFLGDTFTAVCIFAGCVLTLPILLAISRRPAFAALCAHDPEQVSRTIRAARRAAWVVLAMTLLCIIQFIHVAFF